MKLTIKKQSPIPIFKQIVEQVIKAIENGEINPGDRLFPIRSIANQFSINPATVAKAYTELEKMGIIVTGGRMGSYISENIQLPLNNNKEAIWESDFKNAIQNALKKGATKSNLQSIIEEIKE